MGVRIPTLKAIEPTTKLPSPGRITVKAQDQASNILGNVKALASLAKTGMGIAEHFENETANEISDKNNLKLSDWDKEAAGKLSAQMKANPFANPDKLYVEFDKAKEAKYQEILGADKNINERVKGIVTSNLDRTMQSTRSADLQQRSYHKEIYQNNIYQATLKNNQELLPKLASGIKEGDVSSTRDFNNGLHVMKTAIVKRAMSNHGAVKVDKKEGSNFSYIDGEGETVFVKADKHILVEMAKQSGMAAKNSINAMISSNNIEKAKSMISWYGNTIDSKSLTAINNKLNKKTDNNKAYVESAKLNAVPLDERQNAIKKIKDPKLQAKVLELEVTKTKRNDFLRKNREDKNNELMISKAEEMMKSGQAHGMSDLQKTQGFDEIWENMSPKQQRGLEQRFVAPKKSNTDSEERMLGFFMGESKYDPMTVTVGQFSELKEGLSAAKRKEADTMLLRRQNKKSKVPTATYNAAAKQLNLLLYSKGLIKMKKKGLSKKDKTLKNAAHLFLANHIDNYDISNMKEMSDAMEKMVKDMQSEKTFPKKSSSWFGLFDDDEEVVVPVKPAPIVTPKQAGSFTYVGDPLEGLDKKERFSYQKAYRNKTGLRLDINSPKMLQFVYDERKKANTL